MALIVCVAACGDSNASDEPIKSVAGGTGANAGAMDHAPSISNCYTNFTWTANVQYVPSVQTADGNTNGSIRFGSNELMNHITAMHDR